MNAQDDFQSRDRCRRAVSEERPDDELERVCAEYEIWEHRYVIAHCQATAEGRDVDAESWSRLTSVRRSSFGG
jgi:hypothetical protein